MRSFPAFFVPLLSLCLACVPLSAAQSDETQAESSETMPVHTLKSIVARQKELLSQAVAQGEDLDSEALRSQLQGLCHEYEILLQGSPKFTEGYVAYGVLLRKVGMQREALGLFIKADKLDGSIPLVKNQIGNCLAEAGKPREAVRYFLDSVRLDPAEPLYHYDLGKLLFEGKDEFVRSGEWTRSAVEHASHEAFRRAAELAPNRLEFTYRYAESFMDMEKPDYDGALAQWGRLEEHAASTLERETMRLQAAHVLILKGDGARARLLIDSVRTPELEVQKQKLIAQLADSAKK